MNVHSPSLVYYQGGFFPSSDPRLPVDDPVDGHRLGLVETFRTSGGRPHHWAYNRQRLQRACETAGLVVPPHFLANDEARLRDVVTRLLEANGMTEAVFRYVIAAEGMTEFLSLRPLPPAAPADGVTLRVLRLPRDRGEWLPRPKSLNGSNALLGLCELESRGGLPSDEGLFLTADGFLAETTRQCIVWFRDDRIRVPDPALGVVAGTGLAWMLEQNVKAEFCRARVDDLRSADAIVVVNSVRGVTPVKRLLGQKNESVIEALCSHTHPGVLRLQERWTESLRATAET
jgi:4-amino-4-deoxychorismate lyase